ncbi:MAG: zinc ribbon domain-containing protein, partial [Actinobacteria bacterium]|nr:zinc ribbon domain-containing protein [Actinomycetota bacterium]
MFCNKCGGDVGPDNDFCTNCGAPVRRVEQEPMEPSPPLGPAPPTPPGPPVKSPASASLTSPLGIVAIVAVVLIVVAGIVVGVVVATRDGDEGHVSNETGTSETTGQQQADYEENDIKHAREVMNEFLMVYVSGGWCSGSMYMTSSCYEKFCGPDAMYPPPDQGDFDVVGAEVSDYEVIDDNTILFNILQRDRLDQTSPQQELCFADSPRRITTIPEIKPQHVVVSWGLKNDQQ